MICSLPDSEYGLRKCSLLVTPSPHWYVPLSLCPIWLSVSPWGTRTISLLITAPTFTSQQGLGISPLPRFHALRKTLHSECCAKQIRYFHSQYLDCQEGRRNMYLGLQNAVKILNPWGLCRKTYKVSIKAERGRGIMLLSALSQLLNS